MRLLLRGNRILGLTAAGETLRVEAQRLLEQAELAVRRVREAGE